MDHARIIRLILIRICGYKCFIDVCEFYVNRLIPQDLYNFNIINIKLDQI